MSGQKKNTVLLVHPGVGQYAVVAICKLLHKRHNDNKRLLRGDFLTHLTVHVHVKCTEGPTHV